MMHFPPGSRVAVLDTVYTRDLRPQALDDDGRIRVLPAAFWRLTSHEERMLFGMRTGIYSFPTVELVDALRERIAGRTAIEVGAGNGVLAEALGIVATDNYQQCLPEYRDMYLAQGWARVPYGPNVVDMHASRAVRHYKPQVIVAAWVTHKYDPKRHSAGGNPIGVDVPDLLHHVEELLFVGHEHVHRNSRIWEHEPAITFPDFLYSRAMDGEGRDFLAFVPGSRRR